jgi:NADP-dependent 3-hydroxy acid dehydrogenase YdfG
MRRQGDGLIITISSWAGRYDAYVAGAPYNAAKRATLALNTSLNMEEGRHGIRACAICPAEVATPILANRPVPVPEEEFARMLQPDDLGALVVFIARQPPHVCMNEILISPTWNRNYLGSADFHPPPAEP